MVFGRWQYTIVSISLAVALGVGLAIGLVASEKDKLAIELGPDIRPEAVHVHYFLKGGFGGYGDFIDPTQASGKELFLPIDRDGRRATSLRAVVYTKGCELATFALDPLPPGPSRVRFECRKLRTIHLRGTVVGYPRPSELTVRLRYLAFWSHGFFGIMDGPVLLLPIAEVAPDQDGRFDVDLPDFANDAVTESYKGQAEWSVTAWKTGANDQYWLNVDGRESTGHGDLAIQHEYPPRNQFTVRPF
jgi:hypothetical protein